MKSVYYGENVVQFRSKIVPEQLFGDVTVAWQSDIAMARRIVAQISPADFEAALERRNDRLARALRFLADETDLPQAVAEQTDLPQLTGEGS